MAKTCIICGCTDNNACRGGCSWFMDSEVCDRCVLQTLQDVSESFNREVSDRILAVTKVNTILNTF